MDEEIRVWGASNEIIRGTNSAISRDQLSHAKRATPDIKRDQLSQVKRATPDVKKYVYSFKIIV